MTVPSFFFSLPDAGPSRFLGAERCVLWVVHLSKTPIGILTLRGMTILALLAFAIPITQVRELQQGDHSRNHPHHRRPAWTVARATLRVCTDEDCIQQGAYQTLAKLKKNAKGNGIQVCR